MMTLSNDFGMPESFKSNGCGADDWMNKFIPNTIYGVSIFEACRRHDWGYTVGKTIEDKKHADREFLNNMIRIVTNNRKWYYPTRLAILRCKTYYNAVKYFGGVSFWKGK